MPKHEVRLHEQINAPIERVFDFLSDHHHFVSLFGARCTVVGEGNDTSQPNGVGSVRRVGPGPLSFDEQIVVFERPSRIDYAIVRGGPLKNHLGTIHLSPSGDGTEINYTIAFDSKLPGAGPLLVMGLKRIWQREARKAMAAIER
ncbi:MAG TPA: SRPBCC family protein [Solimonas sp.]